MDYMYRIVSHTRSDDGGLWEQGPANAPDGEVWDQYS